MYIRRSKWLGKEKRLCALQECPFLLGDYSVPRDGQTGIVTNIHKHNLPGYSYYVSSIVLRSFEQQNVATGLIADFLHVWSNRPSACRLRQCG